MTAHRGHQRRAQLITRHDGRPAVRDAVTRILRRVAPTAGIPGSVTRTGCATRSPPTPPSRPQPGHEPGGNRPARSPVLQALLRASSPLQTAEACRCAGQARTSGPASVPLDNARSDRRPRDRRDPGWARYFGTPAARGNAARPVPAAERVRTARPPAPDRASGSRAPVRPRRSSASCAAPAGRAVPRLHQGRRWRDARDRRRCLWTRRSAPVRSQTKVEAHMVTTRDEPESAG